MKQESEAKEYQQIRVCQFDGHKEKPIVGFCLEIDCKEEPSYCLNCLKQELPKDLHKGHKIQLLEFEDIKKFIDHFLDKFNQLKEDYHFLQQQLIDCQKQYQKFFFKSNLPIEKLNKIIEKMYKVHSRLIQKQNYITQLNKQLQQQNLRNNDIQLIKQLKSEQKEKKIFLREYQQSQKLKKEEFKNIQKKDMFQKRQIFLLNQESLKV